MKFFKNFLVVSLAVFLFVIQLSPVVAQDAGLNEDNLNPKEIVQLIEEAPVEVESEKPVELVEAEATPQLVEPDRITEIVESPVVEELPKTQPEIPLEEPMVLNMVETNAVTAANVNLSNQIDMGATQNVTDKYSYEILFWIASISGIPLGNQVLTNPYLDIVFDDLQYYAASPAPILAETTPGIKSTQIIRDTVNGKLIFRINFYSIDAATEIGLKYNARVIPRVIPDGYEVKPTLNLYQADGSLIKSFVEPNPYTIKYCSTYNSRSNKNLGRW